MQILFVASEAYPFARVGGLSDVAYALPKALRKLGIDVRVMMPKYSRIPAEYIKDIKYQTSFNVPVGWRNQYCGIETVEFDGIPYYLLDNEYYFKRHDYYGYFDDGERFAYFSRAILESIYHLKDFKPDIIHCNDWHTGIVPVLLKAHYKNSDVHKDIKTVFTIHNLKFQGVFGKEIIGDLLSLGDEYYDENKIKYYDGVSFMKGGIIYSDKVTTVSKTYAEEIKMPYYGEGLHGLLGGIGDKLIGITNGIDYDFYNPKTDKDIYVNYDIEDIEKKSKNKIKLQEELKLEINEKIPMMGLVSRLTGQKGIDLIGAVMDDILMSDVQFVILGTGEKNFEDMFRYYAGRYASKVDAIIGFNDAMAKKIYAASDMFLMPSLFEPCGISQQVAQRYGSLPIVRETGGLKDTVKPYNEYTGIGNGFSFTNYNAHDMLHVIRYAISIYKEKKLWKNIVKQAMSTDNSWDVSAKEYKNLYLGLKTDNIKQENFKIDELDVEKDKKISKILKKKNKKMHNN